MSGTDSGREVAVLINDMPIKIVGATIIGSQLRELAGLPPADDCDLYLESPGLAEDRRVEDDEVVEIHEGMLFFSAPRTILMGLSPRPNSGSIIVHPREPTLSENEVTAIASTVVYGGE